MPDKLLATDIEAAIRKIKYITEKEDLSKGELFEAELILHASKKLSILDATKYNGDPEMLKAIKSFEEEIHCLDIYLKQQKDIRDKTKGKKKMGKAFITIEETKLGAEVQLKSHGFPNHIIIMHLETVLESLKKEDE